MYVYVYIHSIPTHTHTHLYIFLTIITTQLHDDHEKQVKKEHFLQNCDFRRTQTNNLFSSVTDQTFKNKLTEVTKSQSKYSTVIKSSGGPDHLADPVR